MPRETFCIGSPLLANESKLVRTTGFDAIFNKNYEFVYISDFDPWQRVNGTWRGALGHLLNDNKKTGLNAQPILVLIFFLKFLDP